MATYYYNMTTDEYVKCETEENPRGTRNYMFTLNNYTIDELKILSDLNVHYMVVGLEKGKQGTPHVQGFVILKDPKTFTAMLKWMPTRCWIGRMYVDSTPHQCVLYCKKDGDWTERGKLPQKQGKRNDLAGIKNAMANNETIISLLINDTILNYQQLKYAESLTKYYEKPRKWKTRVQWFYGPTGTGKTHTAYELLMEKYKDPALIYTAMDTAKWWDGYDSHPAVIIDDMRKDFVKFHTLLRMLDRYPYRIETKGSTRQFVARDIIITAPYHPEDMYDNREDIQQLLRRIDEIKELKNTYKE